MPGLVEDLLQRAHLAGFFQEEAHSFLEVRERLLFGAAARGNIQFQGLCDERAPFFENPRRELDLQGPYCSFAVLTAPPLVVGAVFPLMCLSYHPRYRS